MAFASTLLMVVPGSAFTIVSGLDNTPRSTVSYCVQSTPPGVTASRAQTLLDRVRANWHLAAGQDGSQALTLTHHNPCQTGTNVRIRAVTTSGGWLARVVAPANQVIQFNNAYTFWDGTGAQGLNYSYEGILAHEIGHTLGLGHAGGTKWSYDANLPICDGSIVVTHSTTNDATVFRSYIRSTSSAAVYVDKVGAYGGA